MKWPISWLRHQMEIFSALLAICAGNSPVPGEFPAQRPVTRSFDVFFDLRPNKRLSKQWWGWWFEMPLSPLRRHCNGIMGCFLLDINGLVQERLNSSTLAMELHLSCTNLSIWRAHCQCALHIDRLVQWCHEFINQKPNCKWPWYFLYVATTVHRQNVAYNVCRAMLHSYAVLTWLSEST